MCFLIAQAYEDDLDEDDPRYSFAFTKAAESLEIRKLLQKAIDNSTSDEFKSEEVAVSNQLYISKVIGSYKRFLIRDTCGWPLSAPTRPIGDNRELLPSQRSDLSIPPTMRTTMRTPLRYAISSRPRHLKRIHTNF